MTRRFVAAAVAVLALAAPAFATRHADLVYLQQVKARQKLLVAADKAKPKAPQQEVAKAPVETPARAADDASSR